MAKRKPRKRRLPDDVTEHEDERVIRELFPEEVARRMEALVEADSDTDDDLDEPDEDHPTPEG